MEYLKTYIGKVNSVSKDELLKDIPDIVETVKSVGILEAARELGVSLAETINLNQLKRG